MAGIDDFDSRSHMFGLICSALQEYNEKHDCFSHLTIDGDNDSAEICVCRGGLQLFISTNDMEPEEDEQ